MTTDDVADLVVYLAPRGWRCQIRRPVPPWDVHVEAHAPPQRRGRGVALRERLGIPPDTMERGTVALRVRGDHVVAEVDAGGPRWLDAAADRWEERAFQALAGSVPDGARLIAREVPDAP